MTAAASGYASATLKITLTVTLPKALSFSTTSLSYSVEQNGTTAKKSSALSANTGTPAVTLSKSAAWVVLPSPATGSLSFGINSAGLAPGTYSATVTAAANGYASATLKITLTVTVPKALSFSTTSLSYSVVQNGTAAKKSSALSANTGTLAVTLSKSAAWVVLPSPATGSLSFGINSAGLAPGTYSATVTAAANGYASATLKITLTVTLPKALSFSTTSLSYSVEQNGTAAKKSAALSANTGTPAVTLSKSAALGCTAFTCHRIIIFWHKFSRSRSRNLLGYRDRCCKRIRQRNAEDHSYRYPTESTIVFNNKPFLFCCSEWRCGKKISCPFCKIRNPGRYFV
ncbi:MAG: hypothetical protein WKG06_26190 [Segetibacter sp.]